VVNTIGDEAGWLKDKLTKRGLEPLIRISNLIKSYINKSDKDSNINDKHKRNLLKRTFVIDF